MFRFNGLVFENSSCPPPLACFVHVSSQVFCGRGWGARNGSGLLIPRRRLLRCRLCEFWLVDSQAWRGPWRGRGFGDILRNRRLLLHWFFLRKLDKARVNRRWNLGFHLWLCEKKPERPHYDCPEDDC